MTLAGPREAVPEFSRVLLAWYAKFGRADLPWRTGVTPYRTVVSEFMLQQTQVDRVVPLFEAFVARWPDFESLAAASQADVMRLWKGLGYNSRAVRLHKLAITVCERFGGALPSDEAALRELPGVGPYTARAIAAFAFDADVAALDTNVRRVVHRAQLGVEWPPLAGPAELDALASNLVPRGSGHAFNSAMMDLGATICSARAPKCLICPLQTQCAAAPIDASLLAGLAVRHARPKTGEGRLRFEKTTRYLRGRIVDQLRELSGTEAISLLDLYGALSVTIPHDTTSNDNAERLNAAVVSLEMDGLLERVGESVRLKG